MLIDKFPVAVINAAQKSAATYNVFASVTLAQWALESAWGTRMSGKNNPFGIKARPGDPSTLVQTHEEVAGRMVATTAKFADYADMDEAFAAHGEFLSTRRYAPVRAAKTPREACEALQQCGYATDSNYPEKLMTIIETYELEAIDHPNHPVAPAPRVPSTVPASPVHKGKVAAAVVAGGAAVAIPAAAGHPELHGVVWGLALAAFSAIGVFLVLHFRKR